MGASVLNWPLELGEKISGHQLPRVPHPHILNGQPAGFAETIGRTIGEYGAPALIPGTAAFKAASLVPKVARNAGALSKLLSGTGQLGAGIGGGALTGAAMNDEDRSRGALTGGALGGLGVGGAGALKALSSLKSKNIAKDITKTLEDLKSSYNSRFEKPLEQGEKLGANEHLYEQGGNLKLLKQIGNSDYLHAIKKYNESPTLKGAHDAQRNLNYYVADLMKKPKSSLRDEAITHAKELKSGLLERIEKSLNKVGADNLAKDYSSARTGYAKDVGPYLSSKAIQQLQKGNIRPSRFADALIEDEKFLAKRGEHHPELKQREFIIKALKSPVVKHIAGYGAAAIGLHQLAKTIK